MTTTERVIVHIDEDKCNGCGLCVPNCAEGAIQIIDGKAKLVSDVYCDGLGACLGPCPTGAISLVTRPAEAFDADAAERHVATLKKESPAKQAAPAKPAHHAGGGCPGSMARNLKHGPAPAGPEPTLACGCPGSMSQTLRKTPAAACGCGSACDAVETEEAAPAVSELMNWPVQLRLIPPGAPYLKNADLLLAADCAAFASPDFHKRFLKNKPVAIACPKLDDTAQHVAKLAEIIKTSDLNSIAIVRMEVPCCGGLERIAQEAVRLSGREVPVWTMILSVDGTPLDK